MSDEMFETIINLEKVVNSQNERIEALEKRVAELEAKVNQVHPKYCNCGKCTEKRGYKYL